MNRPITAEDLNEDFEKCFGRIYLNKKHQVVFHCEICQEVFYTYRNFIKHISTAHFKDCRVLKINKTSKNFNSFNENEIKDFNATLSENDKDMADDEPTASMEDNSDSGTKEPEIIHELKKRTKLKETTCNENREHVCRICDAAFADRSNLVSHMRRHTGKKTKPCKFCPKLFFTQSELNTHMCTHTGERKFVCDTCGKRFLTSGHLTGHKRRHTNERRYKCKYCDKRFFGGASLKEHTMIHLDERNYICEICQASFKKQGILRSHLKIHENKREYICNICNASFNQGPALYSHKKIHGENLYSLNLSDLNNDH